MPEIAEVARIVHFIRKTLVGKTLAVVKAQDDANVFGKVGTSAAEFQNALIGKKVIDAGQQGKYFWMIMSEPPHPVMHFGMTGWFFIKGVRTAKFASKSVDEPEVWPPKFWKFCVETEEEPKVEAAFSDSRRFGRIRLLDCAAGDIRQTTPLKENGPDPIIDRELFTLEWFEKKMLSKKVPVKALLLDQANISGIGNWVGDEVLYHAKLHPEQYSDTFTPAQLKQLHTSILHICQTAVDLLGDASKFPDEWLFGHRWGKGKKDASTTLPNGEKIIFITVGGRTSCVVPSVQKKTGPITTGIKVKEEDQVAEDVKAELKSSDDKNKTTTKSSGKKRKVFPEKEARDADLRPTKTKRQKKSKTKSESGSENDELLPDEVTRKPRKAIHHDELKKSAMIGEGKIGSRRSTRLSTG